MLILAASLTKMAYIGVPKPINLCLAISLAEGFVLTWAGSLSAFLWPYVPRKDLIIPLSVFWLIQAGYSFGWALNWREWEEINWLVPPALGICCFSWIAIRLRAVPVGP